MPYHYKRKKNMKNVLLTALGEKRVICCINENEKPKPFMAWTSKESRQILVIDPPCGCWKISR